MRILVTGGCGYVGSRLASVLVDDGHEIVIVDALWFGNHLTQALPVQVVELDVRDTESVPMAGADAVIHLANVANDPGVELDPTLSWEVNALATQRLADRAARHGVRQFIYASSGSVYGIKTEPNVTEDLELVPVSAYNKTKMVAERALLSYTDAMQIHIVRPATVCGLSPRMRLDVSVNMFVKQAVLDGRLTVYGGEQVRPNIHIDDLVDVYRHFLTMPELPSGAYNAGFENISIREIAHRASQRTGAPLEIGASTDPRSYRQDSSKLVSTGFVPKKTVDDAIREVQDAFEAGDLQDRPEWYTVRWMKEHVLTRCMA